MLSTIVCREYSVSGPQTFTRISTVGPKDEVHNAGGILNAFISSVVEKLNFGPLMDQKTLLGIPIVDSILSAYDTKSNHFTIQKNFVSTNFVDALTSKYDKLVIRINGSKINNFYKVFFKSLFIVLITITLATMIFSLLFPQHRWPVGAMTEIYRMPSILNRAIKEVLSALFLSGWVRAVVSVFGAIFAAGVMQVAHWRKVRLLASFLILMTYATIGLIYLIDLTYVWSSFVDARVLAHASYIESILSILRMSSDILFASFFISFLIAKYKSWGDIRKEIEKLQSNTLLRRLKLI